MKKQKRRNTKIESLSRTRIKKIDPYTVSYRTMSLVKQQWALVMNIKSTIICNASYACNRNFFCYYYLKKKDSVSHGACVHLEIYNVK